MYGRGDALASNLVVFPKTPEIKWGIMIPQDEIVLQEQIHSVIYLSNRKLG